MNVVLGQDTSQDIAVQAPLELNRKGGKRILLKSVMMKTGTQTRRIAGTLEAHVNGLRFQPGRTELIDINYSNIKHALFQPCENELLVLIHFHLKVYSAGLFSSDPSVVSEPHSCQ